MSSSSSRASRASAPTPQYRADMARAAEWVVAKLRAAGPIDARVIPTAGHPVVYGEWLGSTISPTLLVYGHYDVQPPDPLERWKSKPFEPEVRDGRLYGRGVSDNKGPMLIPLEVAQALAKRRIERSTHHGRRVMRHRPDVCAQGQHRLDSRGTRIDNDSWGQLWPAEMGFGTKQDEQVTICVGQPNRVEGNFWVFQRPAPTVGRARRQRPGDRKVIAGRRIEHCRRRWRQRRARRERKGHAAPAKAPAQQVAAAGQPTRQRALRQPQAPCRLAARLAGEVAQDDGYAVLLGQAVEQLRRDRQALDGAQVADPGNALADLAGGSGAGPSVLANGVGQPTVVPGGAPH